MWNKLNVFQYLIFLLILDASGNPVTQSVIPVTDSSGNAVTDANGNPVTQSVVGVTDSNGNPVTGSMLHQCIRSSDL